MTLLAAAGLLDGSGAPPSPPSTIEIIDGHVTTVDGGVRRGARRLDALLAPGFVDLQVNGIGDHDFGAADAPTWRSALQALGVAGITTCLPTITSRPLGDYSPLLDVAAAVCREGHAESAQPLGVHLEGPFIGRAGAHDAAVLRAPDLDWIDALLEQRPGLVRLVTIAPERDPAGDGIRRWVSAGVVVSVGHTEADGALIDDAAAAGATLATHLFNGMAEFHHRRPGPVPAVLRRLSPTLIGDLRHVAPDAIRLALAASERVLLVSDLVAGSRWSLTEDDGAYVREDGVLCGSATTLAGAVANLVGIGVPLERAVAMATRLPADAVAATDRGRLAAGAVADLVALDPGGHLLGVWRAGRELWSAC